MRYLSENLGDAKINAQHDANRDGCKYYVIFRKGIQCKDGKNWDYTMIDEPEWESESKWASDYKVWYVAEPNGEAISLTQEEKDVLIKLLDDGEGGVITFTEDGELEQSIMDKLGK